MDEDKTPGFYRVHWNGLDDLGRRADSGIYLYRFQADDFRTTKKLIVLK